MVTIGVTLGIALATYLVGFMTCAFFGMGRQDDLECAVWGLLCHPGVDRWQKHAMDVLRGA